MSHLDKIEALLERKKLIDAEVVVELDKLKDKSVPLDERWAIFKAFDKANLLQTESYGDGFIDDLGHNLCLYSDFHFERYQTVEFVDMYERMSPGGCRVADKVTEKQRDIWREKVLERGYGSFQYDW